MLEGNRILIGGLFDYDDPPEAFEALKTRNLRSPDLAEL